MTDDLSRASAPDTDTTLTDPEGIHVLRARAIPGGQMTVTGHATFQDVRVEVRGVSSHGLVSIFGDLPPHGVQYRDDDPQVDGVFGEVDFGWLSRFWLTRTSTFDTIDADTPRPGLHTHYEGLDVGVSDTCGTVSLAGMPQLQLVWLDAGDPAGADWVLDGYGSYTTVTDRARVTLVRRVEWTAIWRDITVTVAGIRDDRALVFVATGGVPDFDAPEITHGENTRSGWSAVVPLDQLSLRSWTSIEQPLGAGIVAGCVGVFRGRTVRVGLPTGPAEAVAGDGPVAQKRRGETVTDDFVVHPHTRWPDSSWEWRARVDPAELTELRQISATTTWNGETRTVDAYRDAEGQVYLDRDAADSADVSPLEFTVTPIDPADLPTIKALY